MTIASGFSYYMSAIRNMFLSSSVAIAAFGYANSFKLKENRMITKTIAILIMCMSIAIGIKATNDFTVMIKHHKKMKDLSDEEKLLLENSKTWPLVTYFYISFLFILISLKIGYVKRNI